MPDHAKSWSMCIIVPELEHIWLPLQNYIRMIRKRATTKYLIRYRQLKLEQLNCLHCKFPKMVWVSTRTCNSLSDKGSLCHWWIQYPKVVPDFQAIAGLKRIILLIISRSGIDMIICFLLLLCGNRWGYLLALPLSFLLLQFLQIKLPKNFIRHSIG